MNMKMRIMKRVMSRITMYVHLDVGIIHVPYVHLLLF